MNAVPTPLLGVGDIVLADQLLREDVNVTSEQKLGNIQYQREQTPVSRNDQIYGKIRKNMILLRVYGQNHVSDDTNHRGTHDMVSPVPSLIAVPGLDPDDDHAYKIGSNSETLGLDRVIAEFVYEL